MTYSTAAFLLGPLLLMDVGTSAAVTGCMEPVESLVQRAELIVHGEVLEYSTTPRKCYSDQPLIPNCLALETLTVKVNKYLVGSGPQQLNVRVSHNRLSLLCDDPYSLEKGRGVALFLRREGNSFITIGDEGSVYPLDDHIAESIRLAWILTKVQLTIELSDMEPAPGQRVSVIHTLHNDGSGALQLCTAQPHWLLAGSTGSHGYSGWQDEYSEGECFGEVAPGASATWTHKVPLVDVGPGPASIVASLELYDKHRGSASHGTSVLRSEPLDFTFKPASHNGSR